MDIANHVSRIAEFDTEEHAGGLEALNSVAPAVRMSEVSREELAVEPPRIEVTNQHGLCIRVNHAVRNLLSSVEATLETFIDANMRPHAPFGLQHRNIEAGLTIGPLVTELREKQKNLEVLSDSRSDGLGHTLTIRGIAAEASSALEHLLVNLIVRVDPDNIGENEIGELLHSLIEMKNAMRHLTMQFDGAMLELVQHSGILEKILGAGGGAGAAPAQATANAA